MKSKKTIIIGVAIVIVLIAGASIFKPKQAVVSEETTTQGIAVETAQPVIASVSDKIFTIGEVEPAATYNVTAKASGTVEKVYYEIGDVVEKDAVLFKLETDSFNVTKNTSLAQASNALKQAESAYTLAKDTYEKQYALYQQGALSETALTSAQNTMDNAELAYKNASASYQSTQKQFDDQYDAYVQKSPVSGTIVSKAIEEGQFVSSQVVYTIIPDDAYIVTGSITSKYINEVAKGQPVSIYVKTTDQTYEGEIMSVSQVATKGSYPIEVSIGADDALKSGLYAELYISLETHDNTLTIPKKAIVYDGDLASVFVTGDDGHVKKVSVTTGIADGDSIEILSGITAEDSIVVKGMNYISEGDLVDVVGQNE